MKRHLSSIFLALCLSICLLGTFPARAQLNKPYFFYKGRELIIESRYRDAIEMLNLLLRTETKEYEGYFLRGVAKYNLEDLLGAESDFTSAIEVNPVYTLAYQYRAIVRSRLGNYNEALKDYQEAMLLRPNSAYPYFSRGVTFLLSQQFKRAVDDFTKYLRFEPTDVNALSNRGTSYLYLKDTVRAYTDFNRAIEVNPYNPEGYMRRGLLEVMQRKFDRGVDDLSKAVELDSNLAVAYFYRGVAKAQDQKPVEALADFNLAIARDSLNSVTYFNRAILRSQIGDYNRALEDYDRVARYNPDNVLVFFNRAAVRAQIGDFRGALQDYSRAIELYPDFANAYLGRAAVKNQMRDFRGAESDQKIAKNQIDSYRNKLSDSSFSIWADTSRQYDKMMSFDNDLGRNELRAMVSDVQSEVSLLPLFRVIPTRADTSVIFNPRIYQNARLERFAAVVDPSGTAWRLTNQRTQLPEDSLGRWDNRNVNPSGAAENFRKGTTQYLLRQYASSMIYLTKATDADTKNPFAYLNRAVTQAEMIEFIASLETNSPVQRIAVSTDDPATRLIQHESKRTYDYSEAIADLKKAISLMSELPHLYYNLGNIYCQSGDMPAAIEQYNKAIELFPYFAEAYYNRGLVQIFLRDTQKGCLDLSKSGELGLQEAYTVLKRYCIRMNK